MPRFTIHAVNDRGATVTEVVEAESADSAANIVLTRGLLPVAPVEEGGSFRDRTRWYDMVDRLKVVHPSDLILFTKQFRTMLRAGVSMMKLLEVLENQTENAKLRRVIAVMSRDIQEGASLHAAFSRHPGVFSSLYCGMVQAGEASGALPEVLDRLIYIIEHEQKIKTEIKTALQYPVFVVCLLGVAFFVLLTFVIPKFVNVFTKTGVEIPLPTQICMLLYRFLVQFWYVPLFVTVVAAAGLMIYFRTEKGRLVRDGLLLKMPLIGPLLVKAAMSRFASIFSILQASGVSARDAIRILSGAIGNAAISRDFDRINEMLEEGRGISEPLRRTRYFPPIVVNMIAIGEESGNLDVMLREVSEHYDVEVEYAMKSLSDAIGPALTIGLAAVVGFFALAIFLPMWDMTKMMQ
jgi:type IV pilus assembly protein PilC